MSALLPHVIDLSTNHNVDSFVRTVRLIEAELERRQREFKASRGARISTPIAWHAGSQSNVTAADTAADWSIIDEFSELLSSETGKAEPVVAGKRHPGGRRTGRAPAVGHAEL